MRVSENRQKKLPKKLHKYICIDCIHYTLTQYVLSNFLLVITNMAFFVVFAPKAFACQKYEKFNKIKEKQY